MAKAKTNDRFLNDKEAERIFKLAASGRKTADIAERTGRAPGTIWSVLNKNEKYAHLRKKYAGKSAGGVRTKPAKAKPKIKRKVVVKRRTK